MLGFWGNVIISIASRFVKVMIPRKVWSTDRSTWQYWWDSNVTGHSWRFFVQKYDLEWVVAALTIPAGRKPVCFSGGYSSWSGVAWRASQSRSSISRSG